MRCVPTVFAAAVRVEVEAAARVEFAIAAAVSQEVSRQFPPSLRAHAAEFAFDRALARAQALEEAIFERLHVCDFLEFLQPDDAPR